MSNTLRPRPRRSSSPIRSGSSGTRSGSARAERGAQRGGDGVVRELRVLEACRLSVLAQRRRIARAAPPAASRARAGRTLLNGEELPPFATRELEPGDLLRIETPGGGGYGST